MRALLIIQFWIIFAQAFCQEKHWSNPDQIIVQYAGSIGEISGGIGYGVFKNRANASLHFGHVSKASGGPLNILAGKIIFTPRSWSLSERVTVNPLDVGFMVSYHMGENFVSDWPSNRYPSNYYWWQTSFRLHLLAQPSVTIKIRDYTVFKYATAYFEVNTNDLYFVSYAQNLDGLSLSDIFMMGAGVRLHF